VIKAVTGMTFDQITAQNPGTALLIGQALRDLGLAEFVFGFMSMAVTAFPFRKGYRFLLYPSPGHELLDYSEVGLDILTLVVILSRKRLLLLLLFRRKQWLARVFITLIVSLQACLPLGYSYHTGGSSPRSQRDN
jgi:hypothetical protein